MSESLGEYLRELREEAGLSLRAVETRCQISNGYLSLLEHDKVKGPSPKHLWELARCYGVDYLELMRRAGYPVPETGAKGAATPQAGIVFRGAERLPQEELDEIRELIRLKLRRLERRGNQSDSSKR